MTIKQQGGIFGRNPTFNNVSANTATTDTLTADASADGSIVTVKRDGSDVGSLGAKSGDFFISSDSMGMRFRDSISAIIPSVDGATGSDDSFDLGNDSNRWRKLYLSDNLVLSSGQGIDFSATSGTGTSELFDDYEEGTWTPQDSGASDIGSGTYTKVGRLVTLHALITSNSVSTTTIGNLPFAIGTAYYGGFWTRTYGGNTVSNSQNCRIVALSGSALSLKTNVTTGTDANFTFTTDAAGTVRTSFTAMYEV